MNFGADTLAVLVVIQVVGGIGIFQLAKSQGRDPGAWVIISVLFSPLVAFVALLVKSETDAPRELPGEKEPEPQLAASPTPEAESEALPLPVRVPEAPRKGHFKVCVHCATEVDADEAEAHGACPNCTESWF